MRGSAVVIFGIGVVATCGFWLVVAIWIVRWWK
jgi:hypothetical protein